MKFLVRILELICRVSTRFPLTVLLVFGGCAIAGFAVLPRIHISANLIAGIGETIPVIKLTYENNRLFGEQDSLILALKFPEPPGEARKPFIEGLGRRLEDAPGVRRVLYRFLDPDDEEEVAALFTRFFTGMNEEEARTVEKMFTPEGISDALRRNRNRLFLSGNPYLQRRIIEDPVELGQFVAESLKRRIGHISLGDIYLFVASPDGTTYLIQITPDFPSSDVARARTLVRELNDIVPTTIERLTQAIPGAAEKFEGLEWRLTGKTAFHAESDILFDREMLLIFALSGGLVFGFLLLVYRSLRSVALLMAPIIVAVGVNYAIVYLVYDSINPVVMASLGILFGLGADFGIHLWGRLREEIDRGAAPLEALPNVFRHVGPPVCLGAFTSAIAFLCLMFSRQYAMGQFGFVCATGVLSALICTLFLFPAFVGLLSRRSGGSFPRLRLPFKFPVGFIVRRARIIQVAFPIALVVMGLFAARLSYEEDLFKAFFAEGLRSMKAADRISREFGSNFSQPTFLSFDVEDRDRGVRVQRELDAVLARLTRSGDEIASFDSVSYLTAPPEVRQRNRALLSTIVEREDTLRTVFEKNLESSEFSVEARRRLLDSFDKTMDLQADIAAETGAHPLGPSEKIAQSWYVARIDGVYRFLTKVRYTDAVDDPVALQEVDRRIMRTVSALPVDVKMSGPRQAMDALLATLVSELFRLGGYAVLLVVIFLLIVFRNPSGVAFSLIPMVGAFCVTMGLLGAAKVGIPFSIIGTAPLIFGLAVDNGIHVVMRFYDEADGSVEEVVSRLAPMVLSTSLTTMLGFLAMVVSYHYALRFLGWAMVIGMTASPALTLIVLPAYLTMKEVGAPRHIGSRT